MPLPSAAPAPSAAQIATQNQFVATGGVTPTAGAVDTLISQSPDGSQMWRRPNGDTYQAWASDDPSLNLSLGAAPAMSNGPAAPPSNSQANLVSQAPTAGIFMAPIISDPIVNPILFIGGPATPIINTTVDLPTPTGTASILQSSGQNVPRLATL
jgi:hypothetical protein